MTHMIGPDILIVGGGVGGCAAALAATALGYRVVLSEPTDWIGGQLTAQGVPPDEHPWIERYGCTRRYGQFRQRVRNYYRRNYPLTQIAQRSYALNPGNAWVSGLSAEPRVYLAVLQDMLAAAISAGRLHIMLRHAPIAVALDTDHAHIRSVTLRHLDTHDTLTLTARYFLDASETGDLLPLSGTEYVSGSESQAQTGEPHAGRLARPDNVQSVTWCFAMAYDPDCHDDRYLIDKPANYEQWCQYVPPLTPAWPGPLFSLTYPNPITLQARTLPLFATQPGELDWFGYRRILSRAYYPPNSGPHEVTIVNWPQNDYWLDGDQQAGPRELSRCWFYWLQHEQGHPGLYLRPDLMGTPDGLAKAPYIRESRRIQAKFTVSENHIGTHARHTQPAEIFSDSVGIGYYRIDLHPSTGGDSYIDIESLPFQIPLGALLPIRMKNLLPACKNIGTTHLTNGCYRLHPVEWTIGEAAGTLAAYCLRHQVLPHAVHEDRTHLADYQTLLVKQGVELQWPACSRSKFKISIA